MKKLFYTFITLAFAFQVNAQDYFYANGDFEIWKDTLGYREPKGWFTLNQLSLFGIPESTTRDLDAHSGDYAAKLVTQANSFRDFPAVLSSGYILNDQGEPELERAKVPFAMRPKNFSLFYKAMPGPGDSCSALVLLTRWNMAEQRTDTIGFAGFFIKDSATSYTQIVAPFTYRSPLMPDSALLLIASSANAFAPVPGSTLFIDDFMLGFETGVSEQANTLNNISVYPNPATDLLRISTEETGFDVSLFDLQGRNVHTGMSGQSQCEIGTGHLTAGVYLLEIRSARGVAHQKVVIAK